MELPLRSHMGNLILSLSEQPQPHSSEQILMRNTTMRQAGAPEGQKGTSLVHPYPKEKDYFFANVSVMVAP